MPDLTTEDIARAPVGARFVDSDGACVLLGISAKSLEHALALGRKRGDLPASFGRGARRQWCATTDEMRQWYGRIRPRRGDLIDWPARLANAVAAGVIPEAARPCAPGYAVTPAGDVYSLHGGRPRRLPGQPSYGYLRVVICDGPRRRSVGIHDLVLTTFVGPRPEDMWTRHLNGDRADNRVENLAWGTRAENEADKDSHGARPLGEAHAAAKLTESIVREARRRRACGELTHVLAAEYGVATKTMQGVVVGRSWRHVG